MNSFTPSVYWFTTIDVDFNRAAGREAAHSRVLPLGMDDQPVPQRFRPSTAWRVTCCAYV